MIVSNLITAQNSKIDSLFIEFKKECFYENVYYAKLSLEDRQEEIIPTLIKMLKDTSFVRLTCTIDLIYPGATKFYGHGHYIPYDIDWLSVRAGWLLEELTFQDFGYKTTDVDDTYLYNLMKTKYKEYIENGTYDIVWKNKTPNEKITEARRLQAKIVEKWWKKNKKNWNRTDAIKEALISKDVTRISAASQFLAYGETKCNGLTWKIFEEEIKPLGMELANSENEEIRKHAFHEDFKLVHWVETMSELEKKPGKRR